MKDHLPEEKKPELVRWAKTMIGKESPIGIIKAVREKENCSLSAAKEIYVMAAYNQSLYEYQENLIESLEEIFDALEKGDARVDRENWKVEINLDSKDEK
jgi:hypothetical protein